MSNKTFTQGKTKVIVNGNGNAKVIVNGAIVGSIPQLLNKIACTYSTGVTFGYMWSGRDALTFAMYLKGKKVSIKHITETRQKQLKREHNVFHKIPASLRKAIYKNYYTVK